MVCQGLRNGDKCGKCFVHSFSVNNDKAQEGFLASNFATLRHAITLVLCNKYRSASNEVIFANERTQ